MLGWRGCLPLALCLLGAACTPTTDLPSAEDGQYSVDGRVRVTQGSAVAVTPDQRVAVVTNRTDGIVSIVHLDPSKPLDQLVLADRRTELAFHPLNESKPWVAVIGTDDSAYVLLRGLAQVVKIAGLHTSKPHEVGRVDVGSEPTSMVISPSGKRLFVANSGEGNVSLIHTNDLTSAFWPLNDRLAGAGFLGASAWDRPALAHPRALAITDHGRQDDEEETLYATEFFSQPLLDATLADPDRNRQGIVYAFDSAGRPPLDEQTGDPIPFISLAAVETGFDDAEGNPTGCFPNQLYGAAIQDNRLFVTSVCASPAGPVEAGPTADPARASNNFKTLVHPVIFEIDTKTQREVGSGRVLTRTLEDLYTPDAVEPRMPLMPTEIVFADPSQAGWGQAYVIAFGASAVFPIHFDPTGEPQIGSTATRYIRVGDASLPTGFAVLSDQRALVLDDRRRGIGAVDLQASLVRGWKPTIQQDWARSPDTDPAELISDEVRDGRRLFATGLGAWSFAGQAWSSCESCHPEGSSDGVVWRFARGPRRTISLAGSYYRDDPQRRMLLWTANIDEIHDVEGIARGLSGGVGGVVWNPYALEKPHKNCRLIYDGGGTKAAADETVCGEQKATDERLNGLNGSLGAITTKDDVPCPGTSATCNINATRDWDKIDAFVRTVRAPRAPSSLRRDLIEEGEMLFRSRGCPVCHGGTGWTLSRVFYQPGSEANGRVPSAAPREAPDEVAAKALLGQLRVATYAVPDAASPAFRAAAGPAANGPTTFRGAPPALAPPEALASYVFTTVPPGDQINCVLRSVGTFGAPAAPDFLGITPDGAPVVHEVRRVLDNDVYVEKLALGSSGFNIPSLVGLAGGGPYFHAGNARTLEELFDPAFAGHHLALGGQAPTPAELLALVSYLLSIDESDASVPVAIPRDLFDPDLCGQLGKSPSL